MLGFDHQELREWSDGEWVNALAGGLVRGFSFDSRSLAPGDMFVALKTPKRDGHDFIEVAKEKGAAAALVSAPRVGVELPQLVVEDSLDGLGDIAHGYRKRSAATVIGVTGSCGKTTFKDLLDCLLGGKPSVWSTDGNLNNRIGVPVTLLRMPLSDCRFAIVEAGISERGEMESLAGIIDPDIAVFTSIGPAHLEGLGSLTGIAEEKGRLAIKGGARRVYLGESCLPFKEQLAGDLDYRVVAEGKEGDRVKSYSSSVSEGATRISLQGIEKDFIVNGIGKGLASNVAMALTTALDLGIDVSCLQERLRHWTPSRMRGEWKTLGSTRVYLDCYNANPQSMIDALDTFDRLSDGSVNRMFLVGSMEELGERSEEWHRKVGASMKLRESDLAFLIGDGAEAMNQGIGDAGRRGKVELISGLDEARQSLSEFSGDVFIKGSRRYGLESAVQFLEKPKETEKATC